MTISIETNMSVANSNTIAYEVEPTAVKGAVDILLTNTGADDVTVTIYISPSNSPEPKHEIGHNITLTSGETFERTCALVAPGEKVVVNSSHSTVAIRCAGINELPSASSAG